MSKEDEYVVNALKSLDLAERATSLADRAHLLNLGERWLDLVSRIRQRRLTVQGVTAHLLLKAHVASDGEA
jgi:hypothetical protein